MQRKFDQHLKDIVEVDKKIRSLEKEIQEKAKMQENDKEIIKQLNQRIEQEMQNTKSMSDGQAKDMRRLMLNNISSIKKVLEQFENHIGCLSCSKVTSDSLMLLCGHSICTQCLK